MAQQNNQKNILNNFVLKNFENYCYSKLYKTYNLSSYEYNKMLISNIIYNEKDDYNVKYFFFIIMQRK